MSKNKKQENLEEELVEHANRRLEKYGQAAGKKVIDYKITQNFTSYIIHLYCYFFGKGIIF